MRQRQARDPRDRCYFRGVHRDPRGHRPDRAWIRERSPSSRDSRRTHSLQAFRCGPHRHHFAGWPDRCAHPDVTVLAVDNGMMTDLQDRKAHHLISPRLILVPLLFPPVTHSGTPGRWMMSKDRPPGRTIGPLCRLGSAAGIYGQDSAICAIASKRLETPSLASCRNSSALMRMLPPHVSVSTIRASGGAVWSERIPAATPGRLSCP